MDIYMAEKSGFSIFLVVATFPCHFPAKNPVVIKSITQYKREDQAHTPEGKKECFLLSRRFVHSHTRWNDIRVDGALNA